MIKYMLLTFVDTMAQKMYVCVRVRYARCSLVHTRSHVNTLAAVKLLLVAAVASDAEL